MSHEIDFSLGRAAFVFAREDGEAWHGLGSPIDPAIANDPRKIAAAAGAGFSVYASPVQYADSTGTLRAMDNRVALVRDDTHGALEVVSDSHFRIVQPSEIFESYRDALAAQSLTISSAGVLKGGRIVFVCAKLSPDYAMTIGESADDSLGSFVTMGTGFDGATASFGRLSTLRTVCWNTLSANLSGEHVFKVGHSSVFDGSDMARAIGIAGVELRVQSRVFNRLARSRVGRDELRAYFARVLDVDASKLDAKRADGKPEVSTKARNQLEALARAYLSGPGATLETSAGTLWGAVNAVTYYADHVATVRDTQGDGANSTRIASSQFGSGAKLKARALAEAMRLAGIGKAELEQLAIAA